LRARVVPRGRRGEGFGPAAHRPSYHSRALPQPRIDGNRQCACRRPSAVPGAGAPQPIGLDEQFRRPSRICSAVRRPGQPHLRLEMAKVEFGRVRRDDPGAPVVAALRSGSVCRGIAIDAFRPSKGRNSPDQPRRGGERRARTDVAGRGPRPHHGRNHHSISKHQREGAAPGRALLPMAEPQQPARRGFGDPASQPRTSPSWRAPHPPEGTMIGAGRIARFADRARASRSRGAKPPMAPPAPGEPAGTGTGSGPDPEHAPQGRPSSARAHQPGEPCRVGVPPQTATARPRDDDRLRVCLNALDAVGGARHRPSIQKGRDRHRL